MGNNSVIATGSRNRRARPHVFGPGPSNREPIDHPAINWLMRELEARKLTRTNAAKEMGISQSHFSGVITGDKPLTLEVAARFVVWGMPESVYTKTVRAMAKGMEAKASQVLEEVRQECQREEQGAGVESRREGQEDGQFVD